MLQKLNDSVVSVFTLKSILVKIIIRTIIISDFAGSLSPCSDKRQKETEVVESSLRELERMIGNSF